LIPEVDQTTNNNNKHSSDCVDLVTIFGRGTNEPGLIGTSVGPALLNDLSTVLPDITQSFVGVDYPADWQGAVIGGSIQGSRTMAQMITNSSSTCSTTKIVMAGYSQGAQLVHNAAGIISSEDASSVVGVVMFGDPYNGTSLANGLDSRSKTWCHPRDQVCQGILNITAAHLTYHLDGSTLEAAQFIAEKFEGVNALD
ncbi:cutinase, partial [Flagelloscypha sp. PMI_526]